MAINKNFNLVPPTPNKFVQPKQREYAVEMGSGDFKYVRNVIKAPTPGMAANKLFEQSPYLKGNSDVSIRPATEADIKNNQLFQ